MAMLPNMVLACGHASALPSRHACGCMQVYEQLRAAGLQYGPSFRLLRNIHVPDAAQQASA